MQLVHSLNQLKLALVQFQAVFCYQLDFIAAVVIPVVAGLF